MSISASSTAGCSLNQMRSEEHTSELQSHLNLVCRLLLEKKKRDKMSQSSWNDPERNYTTLAPGNTWRIAIAASSIKRIKLQQSSHNTERTVRTRNSVHYS